MRIKIKKPKFIKVIAIIEIILLTLYLLKNIANVGSSGVALPLLGLFVLTSAIVIAIYYYLKKKRVKISYIHIMFSCFLLWVTIRATLDFNTNYELKQLTVGTTGGILLFYLIGVLCGFYLSVYRKSQKNFLLLNVYLVFFLLYSIWLYKYFAGRLLSREDILYVEGVSGGYQRSGNFLTICYILVSSFFLVLSLSFNKIKKANQVLWSLIYIAGTFLLLICSQMIGSNSATANILAIFLITMTVVFIASNKKNLSSYINNNLSLPVSKKSFKSIVKYSITSIIILVFSLIYLIDYLNFDISRLRVTGFGAGNNTSLTSRFEILTDTGFEQLTYAPMFGNLNVAYLTTGRAGKTLHNLFPNIIAELGLIGLIIFISLLYYSFKKLYKEAKVRTGTRLGFNQAIISTWAMFILIYLVIYANLSVGFSWIVIWFLLGFFSTKNA